MRDGGWLHGGEAGFRDKSFTCALAKSSAECLRRPLSVRPRDLDSCTQDTLQSAALFIPIELHDPVTRTLCPESCSSCTPARPCTAAGSTCIAELLTMSDDAAKGRLRSSTTIPDLSSHAPLPFIRPTRTKYFWSTRTRAFCRLSRKCIFQTRLKRFERAGMLEVTGYHVSTWT